MSEEGELKKRIHKAYGILDDGICHEECLPNIDKILEMMWSEYPKQVDFDYLGWKFEDYLKKVDEWFLRWKGTP